MSQRQDSLLDRLERRYHRFAIRNLMLYIVIGMAAVYIIDYIVTPMTGFSLQRVLQFNRNAIMRGEIWRLVTFIFMPPNSSLLWIALSLYFYYLIGTGLQNQWGSFKFNLFYLCGMLGSVVAGMITGYSTNTYLNLSLFLAFAVIYPNFEVILLFLPVKVKYLALLSCLPLVLSLIQGSWSSRLALLMSLMNVVLFFWRDLYQSIKNAYRRYQWRKNWR